MHRPLLLPARAGNKSFFVIMLDNFKIDAIISIVPTHGGIAQLGERLNGIQEVSGSIPLISTKGS